MNLCMLLPFRFSTFRPSILLLVLIGCCSDSNAAGVTFSNASLEGLHLSDGTALSQDSYRGKYRMVLFGFTSCADVCPMTLVALRDTLNLLGQESSQVVPIFISVDPERDTGAALDRYVNAFDSRIVGVSGKQATLTRVASGHGVFFEKKWLNVSANVYTFDHSASLLLIDPQGKLAATVSTVGPPNEVAQKMVAAFQLAQQ